MTNILVAEDSPDLATAMKAQLIAAGYSVTLASNGQEVLDCPSLTDIDIVIMDIQMPVLNGFEATRKLREQGFTLPVLACSGMIDDEIEKKAAAAGCNRFMAKPVELPDLLPILIEYTQRLPAKKHGKM